MPSNQWEKWVLNVISDQSFVSSGAALSELESLKWPAANTHQLAGHLVTVCIDHRTAYRSRLAHRQLLRETLCLGLSTDSALPTGLHINRAILSYGIAALPDLESSNPLLALSISLKGKLGALIKLATRVRAGEDHDALLELRNSKFVLGPALRLIDSHPDQIGLSGVSLREVLAALHAANEWTIMESDIKKGYLIQLHKALPKTRRHTLHDCVVSYHTGALKGLISAGAPAAIEDHFGRSPLHLAEIVDAVECRESLLEHNVVDRADGFGRSAAQTRKWIKTLHQERFSIRSGRDGGWSTDTDSAFNIERCDIDVVDGSKLTLNKFLRDYVSCLKPVLIKGGVAKLAELQTRWNRKDFHKKFGSMRVSSGPIPYSSTLGLSANHRPLSQSGTGQEDYVFSPIDRRRHRDLFEDLRLIGPLLKLACTHWQLYQGILGTGAPMHLHVDAWNALIFGRKRWMVLPPSRSRYSTMPAVEFCQKEVAQLDTLQWVQEAGDICYIPRYWSHSVLNLQECVGVAAEFTSPYVG